LMAKAALALRAAPATVTYTRDAAAYEHATAFDTRKYLRDSIWRSNALLGWQIPYNTTHEF